MLVNRWFILVTGLTALVLGGCAATSTFNYTPTVNRVEIQNTKQVSIPFDATWDKLVKNLSSDFFIINNIDKNSRLINISFSSQKPSDFADCGRTTRSFTNARGSQNYEYFVADSVVFTTTNQQGLPFNVQRTTKLDGRTNIYIAPEGVGTLITLNTRYVLSNQVNYQQLDGRPGGSHNFTWDFSTKQGYSKTEADGRRIQCHATGDIERRILSLVD